MNRLSMGIGMNGQPGLNEVAIDLNNIFTSGLYYMVSGNETMKVEARPVVVR